MRRINYSLIYLSINLKLIEWFILRMVCLRIAVFVNKNISTVPLGMLLVLRFELIDSMSVIKLPVCC